MARQPAPANRSAFADRWRSALKTLQQLTNDQHDHHGIPGIKTFTFWRDPGSARLRLMLPLLGAALAPAAAAIHQTQPAGRSVSMVARLVPGRAVAGNVDKRLGDFRPVRHATRPRAERRPSP
jgi:hypothetical protein